METISKNIKLIIAMVLGILLILMGINTLPAGGAGTAFGVIELILGILAVIAGLIPLFVKSEGLEAAFLMILTMIVPIYYLVADIIALCNGAAEFFEIVDWILTILKMVACVGVITFVIVYACSKQESVAKIGQIMSAVLLAILLIDIVLGGTVGNISLIAVIFLASFAVLSYKFFGPMDILKK